MLSRARCVTCWLMRSDMLLWPQVMERRLLGRNEGRTDDNMETIRKRFHVSMHAAGGNGRTRRQIAATLSSVWAQSQAGSAPVSACCVRCLGAFVIQHVRPLHLPPFCAAPGCAGLPGQQPARDPAL